MTASIGTFGQLGIAASGAATTRFDYVDESLVLRGEHKDTNGVRGTRSHSVERNRSNLRRVGGPIRLQPTALDWVSLLPWILGGSPTGNVFPLTETLPSRDVTIDRVIKVFQYTTCKVDQAVIRGSQGEPLELTLQLVGVDETVGNAGTFPSLTIDITTQPFMFIDLVMSINATTVNAKDFTLTINNMIDKERFFNSRTLTAVNSLDRMVTLSTQLPYGDFAALYDTGPDGVAATATFTNGGTSLLFTMPKVAFPPESPNTPGRQEIMLPLEGVAFKSGSTAELTATLDSTP